MDEELNRLEAELKRLRPLAPSPRSFAAVERELERPATTRARVSRWWWAAIAPLAAAAMVVFLFIRRDLPAGRPDREPQSADALMMKPIALEKLLVSAEDEGLVTLDDGQPARRARLQYVDTITWKNPRTNASLTWSVPREEVRVVPIRFQ
jgi:hypothetical protein